MEPAGGAAPCWWSTRSTAPGPRWRASSPAASRWRPRRCRDADDGRRERRLRGGDPLGRGLPGRARRGAGRGAGRARCRANERPVAAVLDLRLPRAGPRGRTTEVLAELIDASSVGGATFELGSARFDMTRVVTGQLDAYVEPGPRLVADVPGHARGVRARGRRRGAQQLALRPGRPRRWCCEEAGVIVTDAYGRAARRPAAARLGRRVPDVGGGQRQRAICTRASSNRSSEGVERLKGIVCRRRGRLRRQTATSL